MNLIGKIITINGWKYKVKKITTHSYQHLKSNVYERYKNGEKYEDMLITYNNYHIESKAKHEKFNRIFVYTEQEFKQLNSGN